MAVNHIRVTNNGALRIITTHNPSKKNAWDKVNFSIDLSRSLRL